MKKVNFKNIFGQFMILLLLSSLVIACASTAEDVAEDPIELRLGVSMSPPELLTFMDLIEELDQAHPEWIITVEQTPRASQVEKMNADAAAGTLPDVQEIVGSTGLLVSDVFLPLDQLIADSNLDLTEFYEGPLAAYVWDGRQMALPSVTAPELLFYNIDKFDEAGLPYPTNEWTWDDLRETALQLTLDSNGNAAIDPDFNPDDIIQWGYNVHPGLYGSLSNWFVEPWGDGFCVNEDCTEVNMTSVKNIDALTWWHDFVVNNHGALRDVHGGSQTGVPGDPFINGFTAMGTYGYFGIGQIKSAGDFNFGIVQVPEGPVTRAAPTSIRGYAIASNSEHPEQAWLLIQKLTSAEFLADMWARPGHSVPAKKSAALSISEMPDLSAEEVETILAAAEYAKPWPLTAPGSFEAYIRTMGIGNEVFSTPGLSREEIAEKYLEMEIEANKALSEALEDATSN